MTPSDKPPRKVITVKDRLSTSSCNGAASGIMTRMGEVYAEVKFRSNGKTLTKRLLVDTGATFSWLKESDLKKLGVKATDSDQFETIEGKMVRKKLGAVEIEILGRRSSTIVVFGREKDSEVLGLYALEGLRLEVDPVNRELKRSRAVKAL